MAHPFRKGAGKWPNPEAIPFSPFIQSSTSHDFSEVLGPWEYLFHVHPPLGQCRTRMLRRRACSHSMPVLVGSSSCLLLYLEHCRTAGPIPLLRTPPQSPSNKNCLPCVLPPRDQGVRQCYETLNIRKGGRDTRVIHGADNKRAPTPWWSMERSWDQLWFHIPKSCLIYLTPSCFKLSFNSSFKAHRHYSDFLSNIVWIKFLLVYNKISPQYLKMFKINELYSTLKRKKK